MTVLILASASPARARMLRDAGLSIEVKPADVDESAIKESYRAANAPSRDLADALAEMKAKRIGSQYPDTLTLGADQILAIDGRSLDKPRDLAEAREQLRMLRGRSHDLLSAAVICEGETPVWRQVGVARLTMRRFTDTFLDEYLAEEGDVVLSTVGGYRIEGRGAQLFDRISGDYFSILGLPLLELLDYLRMRGLLTE